MPMTERSKAIDQAILQIEKQFGKASIMKLGGTAGERIDVIPSGSLPLDLALGVGGYPRGRVVEIYGPEASGKTTLALHAAASVQRAGGTAAFIDAEHALDAGWARTCGVNTDELLVSQPDNGEQALEIADTLVRSGAVDLVIVDSVAALVPKAEIEGEMGDSHMGLQARLMSQALRKLTAAVAQSRCTLIFINQIRNKIGVMFGNPETTTGGLALKFYATMRLEIRRIENIKEGDVVVGARARVKIVKNKVAPPYRTAEFEMIHGFGVSREGCLIDMGVEAAIVEKSGAWFLYDGERLGQGRENAKAYLKHHVATGEKLEKALREKFLVAPVTAAAPGAEAVAESAPAEKAAAEKPAPRSAKKS